MGRSPAKAPPSTGKGQRTLASFFGPGAGDAKKTGGVGAGDSAPAAAEAGKAPLKDASNGEGRVSQESDS
jgi:hypothetical protein